MEAQFYLKHLVIQNFATFKNQSIRFRPGFNAIIGETGSGKSLVLDALQLILGARADKKIVRKDTEYSLIEASFSCRDEEIKTFLQAEGFPMEGSELIIKRMIHRNGSSRSYINHLSCPVSFLSAFSRRCVDLVGQFENQRLLSENYQLQLLDHFAKLTPRVSEYQRVLNHYRTLVKQKHTLEQSQANREQRLDYLNYQLAEIEKLSPSSQDEEELLRKKNLLMNLEKLQKISHQVHEIFQGTEEGAGFLPLLKSLTSLFMKNPDLFQDLQERLGLIEDGIYQLKEHLDGKLNSEIDPEELESVLDRLDLYQKLKKKFGGTVGSMLDSQKAFADEKKQLEEMEFSLGSLSAEIESAENELKQHVEKLHETRIKESKRLALALTAKVRQLKMEGCTVKLQIEKSEEFLDTGITKVSYFAETNPGEGFYKIKDIASGGELSRILLSVRQILSAHDSISVFLFDEIDTGIGGETANYIGKALSEVAHNGQVIAITHLPQISQFADTLIMVQKEVNESRTESKVKELVRKKKKELSLTMVG